MNPRRLLVLAVLTFSCQVFAGPKVALLEPVFSGSGCPKGTADVFISDNAKRIDVIFDSFSVEAGSVLGHVASNKECDASIRIKVPHGYSVAIERVKYNGISKLPFGSNAHLIGSHFFNYEQLAIMNKRFYGHSISAFDINTRVPFQGLSWSPCGEEALITSRTKLAVSATKSVAPASVQVDDRSNRPGISYYLLWRTCSGPRDY